MNCELEEIKRRNGGHIGVTFRHLPGRTKQSQQKRHVRTIGVLDWIQTEHHRIQFRSAASTPFCPISYIHPVHRTATYTCDDTRGCVYNFDLLMMSKLCSKHVEA